MGLVQTNLLRLQVKNGWVFRQLDSLHQFMIECVCLTYKMCVSLWYHATADNVLNLCALQQVKTADVCVYGHTQSNIF